MEITRCAAQHHHARIPVLRATLGLWLLVSGCAGLPGGDKGEATGLLQLRCDPPDATIFIDGERLGVVQGWRDGVVPVSAGRRRVELRRPGYYPYLLDLDMAPGGSKRLTLELIRRLDDLDDLDAPPPATGDLLDTLQP